MGWSIGYDGMWQRDIGYGVPAYCDHPDCDEEIDRGLSYVCGGEPYGGAHGCGLYFCSRHRPGNRETCERCSRDEAPFMPKAEHPTWITHKLTDESWAVWRDENPAEVVEMTKLVAHPNSDGAVWGSGDNRTSSSE